MIQFTVKAGSTSVIIPISIYDSSSTVGAKLAGLAYNTSGTIYYNRTGAAGAATAISPVTATKGTWTSSGFVQIDNTNMPGDYELHLPDAAIAAGATSVMVQIKGATNAVPVNILIELTVFDMQVATQKVDVDTIKTQAITCAAGVTVLASVGTASTSTAQTGDSFAIVNGASGCVAIKTDTAAVKVKTDYLPSVIAGGAGGVFIAGTNAATTITTALTTTFTGNLTGTVAKSPATLAAADVTGNLPVDVKAITTGVDFNAAMKTSLNAATPASVTGAVGSVTAAVSVTGDLSATMKTSVNTEVCDVIKTDTIPELSQAAPAATPTLYTALMLLYMALRNQITTTSSVLSISNDAGTVICKSTGMTDDSTTFTRPELVSGP